ncbi:tyrosine-type recombinase/integrase [bacterium]|nr:tyrosine-type recombinase/integrase [bacterium]
MICYVVKRKGRRLWRGRYRLHGQAKIKEVSLHSVDRQVAEKRLRDLVSEKEQEAAGIIAPRSLREAAQRSLVGHLTDFIADLTARKASDKHINNVSFRGQTLIRECTWRLPSDVSPNSFIDWRAHQKLAPKTLNDYLGAVRSLLNWMVEKQRLSVNPLSRVEEVETNGHKTRVRRAFTVEEMKKLVAAAGPRKAVYLVAVHTGLRRSEIGELRWGYLKLGAGRPHLHLPGEFTKNGEDAIIPLHPDVVMVLQGMKTEIVDENDLVFPKVPRIERFRRDLAKAKVPYQDSRGRVADFHALRYTFDTHLQATGAVPRVAMELMRHSDPRLTLNRYVDTTLLPTAAAVDALPSYLDEPAVPES